MRKVLWSGSVAAILPAAAVVWGLVTSSAADIVATQPALYADPRYSASDLGDGELALALLDVRMGILLVMLCAITALVAPRVRAAPEALAASILGAVALVVANGLLTRAAGGTVALSALTAGGLLTVAILVPCGLCRRLPAAHRSPEGRRAGRNLLVAMATMAAAAVTILEALAPTEAWVRDLLPRTYMIGLSSTQAMLALCTLGLLVVASERFTALGGASLATITLLAGSLVLGSPISGLDSPVGAMLIGSALTAAVTVAAVAGSRSRDDGGPSARTVLLVVAGAASGYAMVLLPAVLIGVPFGVLALGLAGGKLGADGLPLLIGGASAGLVGLCTLLVVERAPWRRSSRATAHELA